MWGKVIASVSYGGWRFFKAGAPAVFKGVFPAFAAALFWLTDGAWEFLGVMWELMPDELAADIQPHLAWLHVANAWFPLDLWFQLTMQFYTAYLTFVAVRTVYRSIPTLA